MSSITCPTCGTALANRVLPPGKTVACTKCGAKFKLPPAIQTTTESAIAPVTIRTTPQMVELPKRRTGLSWFAAAAIALLLSLISIVSTALVMSDVRNDSIAKDKVVDASQPRGNIAREKAWELELRRQRSRIQDSEGQLARRDSALTQRESQLREREQSLAKREIEMRLKEPEVPSEHADAGNRPEQPQAARDGFEPKKPEGDRKETGQSVAELLKEQIAILQDDPSPNYRATAAMMLGQLPGQSELVVPVLQTALQKEVSPQVVTAILHAFGNLGSHASAANVTILNFITTTKNDTLRKQAFEALVAIDRKSAAVQKVLTTAIVGGSGNKPVSLRSSRSGPLEENRLFALETLINLAEDAKWAIPLLVDLADVAVKDRIDEPYGLYGRDQILEKTIEAMLAIDARDKRVYQSIKRMGLLMKANSSERDNLTRLRIQIDSAVKEMERIRREQEEK